MKPLNSPKLLGEAVATHCLNLSVYLTVGERCDESLCEVPLKDCRLNAAALGHT